MKVVRCISFFLLVTALACKENKQTIPHEEQTTKVKIDHAKGFSIKKNTNGISIVTVTSPWPNAKKAFTYALVPKEKMPFVTLNKDEYDAIISVPVDRIIVTSTTHIPALEALGVENKLIGFPNINFVSSPKTRKRIDNGEVKELGINESLNTEIAISLNPDVVFGFGIDGNNKTYGSLQRSNIPVVYNGDWAEESPLGKAEWIKFFAPFFNAEAKANLIFNKIKKSYDETKLLTKDVKKRPTVITGGLFKDIWHVSGGKSWMAQFLKDAKTDYLWKNTQETGSIALSWENVFTKGATADFWLSPSMHTTYKGMAKASPHYLQFDAYQNKKIYTNTIVKGKTGGLLYYELAPNRPDLVLKDLIHIFHPDLLPEHNLVFFKPLQ